MLSLLCCRPKSPEGEESVLSENQHQYDEETRRVNSFFFKQKKHSTRVLDKKESMFSLRFKPQFCGSSDHRKTCW